MTLLFNVILFLQQDVEQIKEKIENAPDKGYEIGVALGTFLPLILLIGLAYLMFYWSKKRRD